MTLQLRPARQKECAKCKLFFIDNFFFCPNCGGKLTVPNFDKDVYRKLKYYRKETAKLEGIKLGYIFSNHALMHLSTHLPKKVEDLYDIQGLPQYSIQQRGQEIISIISENRSEVDSIERLTINDYDDEDSLIGKLVDAIVAFESKYHKNEKYYQKDLFEWLKPQFPDIKREQRAGRTRPDLALHKIGIEIKGPTRQSDLITVADKCVRYYEHFDYLIFVFFDISVKTLDLYREWKDGILRQWPNVRIITKNYSESNKCIDCGKPARYDRCLDCYKKFKQK